MQKCAKCDQLIQDGAFNRQYQTNLCEDCYIDAVLPDKPKASYDNAAEFMNRLKDAHSIHQQRYH